MVSYPIPRRLRGLTYHEEQSLLKHFSKAEVRRIKREINNAPNAYSAATGERILVRRKVYGQDVVVAEVKFDQWNWSNGGSPWVFCVFPYGEPRDPDYYEEEYYYFEN